MTLSKIYRIIALIMALTLCMGVSVYASVGADFTVEVSEDADIGAKVIESMIVSASWLDGEMLRIDVLDAQTGNVSSLAVRISDFVDDTGNSPHILIQAVDLDGNLSGIVRINNPFYVPAEPDAEESGHDVAPPDSGYESDDDYAEPPQLGLTPDGTGTVVDNATNHDGIEFFTVFTEDGNEFFLVVDRQRNTDNVYLLNAVTEEDLMALAQRSGRPIGGVSVSQIPEPEEVAPPEPPASEPEPEPQPISRSNIGNIVIILIVAAIAGGAGYYFKIYKPKKDAEYFDEEDEMGYDKELHEVDDDDFADDSHKDGDAR